jgi:small Trp-rich protein
MGFLIIGLLLLAMHFAGIGAPARWNFQLVGDLWKFALPFVLAVVWWSISDKMGLTQKRAIRQMDRRREERRIKAFEALGLHARRERPTTSARTAPRRSPDERADRSDVPGRIDLPAAPPAGEPARKEPQS